MYHDFKELSYQLLNGTVKNRLFVDVYKRQVRDHHDCTSGIVVFETLCHCKDNPDEEFYKNIDRIVDGYNQGLEYYLNELD